ncbi:prenyltransferase [Endozoicomonas sp.]|nr:prenyltransferase [Endozoicomonas sp.]
MDMPYPNPDKYRLIRALRPFSYSVALISCGLGVALASSQGHILRAVLVIVAGVLLQAASNLANDYADIYFWKQRTGHLASSVIRQIRLNCILALVLTLISCAIGIWLTFQVGWALMLIGVVGIVGGYCYTGEPVHYKRLGLGVPAVFIFTGVLMVTGAYYAVTGLWNNQVIYISVPVSLLSSALLFSNEIRDYLDDRRAAIRTLTVRVGFSQAKIMYACLLFAVYPVSFYLYWKGMINNPLYLLPSLLFLWQPVRHLSYGSGDIQLSRLPPLTGRFFLFFGIGFMLSVL